MDKIIDKITTYNIFTNMFPGVIYCYASETLFGIPLVQDKIIVAVFLYYFVGMVISRISSVIIEPLLRLAKFVQFADYTSYIAASEKDEKIGVLLETGNSYRSVVALLVCLLATGIWETVLLNYAISERYADYILLVLLLALFLFAYRKQTEYIVSRIERHNDDRGSSS